MNRLDLMPQAPSRPAEPNQASRGIPSMADAQQGAKGAAGGMTGFDTLLEGFSRGQGRETMNLLQDNEPSGLAEQATEPPATDAPGLQALLAATLPDGSPAGLGALPLGSQVYAALESLLPRILPQAGASGPSHAETRRDASPMLSLLNSDATPDSILHAAIGPKLSVSVQNQETHFRPVVEGFETALQGTASTEALSNDPGLERSAVPATRPPSADRLLRADDEPAIHDAEVTITRRSSEETNSGTMSLGRMVERAEAPKPAAPVLQKSDGGSLPAGTLHQVARAILDDVSEVSGFHQPSFQGDGVHRVAVARASGGVLRVLSLQLNPVELGLVTVKMRLFGDSLEMELQVEKPETAELLRNDAEKLSGLLRTSGYRPDAITIQTAESTSHDRNSFQRPDSGAQDQSFQGHADGQKHSSRHHRQYGPDEQNLRNEPGPHQPAGSGSAGGIYL